MNGNLRIGDFVRIKATKEWADCFTPKFLRHVVGVVWQIDDEHIYVKTFERDVDNIPYVSGPHRYPFYMISVEKIDVL